MTQQITATLTGTAATVIAGGQVADPDGNLWDLPTSVTIPTAEAISVTAAANAANPNATWPGSNITLTIETPVVGWDAAKTPDQVTPVVFLTNFPEFGNATNYPIAQIQLWLSTAYKRLPSDVWDDLLDLGAQLYAAHNLVLGRQAARAAGVGIEPGINSGPLNNKSVDKTSAGYDSGAAAIEGAGNYNVTTYGTRFYELVKIMGAGAIQVGTGEVDEGSYLYPWMLT